MPKRSRIRRLIGWFATLGASIGALFYPKNLKNALSNVTKNWKEYICFYLATLAMSTGFWVVALCTESNLVEARHRVEDAYDYHVEVAVLNNEQYANLDAVLAYEISRKNEYLADYYWVNGDDPLADGTYTVHIKLDDRYGLETAYSRVYTDMLGRITVGERSIRYSPLYTFGEDFGEPYTVQFWAVTLLWLVFSVLMLLLIFLIRLDHFRFIYGIYMTFGADFPRLIGAAGGELLMIAGLTWIPSALIGVGIAAALYLPAGTGLYVTARVILTVLAGAVLSVLLAVWFPVRRMSSKPPVRHLAAGDNTSLVSSPRRSFFLFGERFPGKYELYGFWRMRRYYLRLVLSAVLFAAVFVSGLYVAGLVEHRDSLDAGEYVLVYADTPHAELTPTETEAETEAGEMPMDPTVAEMVWGDLELFIEDVCAIPGVSHMEWDASVSGGYTLSHLLLQPGQLYNAANYTVASDERASEGFRWAANNYAYTPIDKVWIDHQIEHGLYTFEGDPYAVLTKDRHVIISEDIFNVRAYGFAPGDTVMVAVCEKNNVYELITDPRELLRLQIRDNEFRYETYTVAAVMRGGASGAHVTLGVTYDDFTRLTGAGPVRDRLTVYMENGTDLDTVRAAESEMRRLLSPLGGWRVVPTGNFFESQVRALKNDRAVVLTLAVCLLVISPMIWYFSQVMFYRKRRREFALLYALGAPRASFAKIYRLAGGVLAGLAFLCTVVLSYFANFLVYFLINNLLPKLHLIESVHYDLTLSVPALMCCVVMSVLCGYFSCEVPYRLFTKRELTHDRIDLS